MIKSWKILMFDGLFHIFVGKIPIFDAEFPSQTQSQACLRKGPRGRTQLPMPRDIHGTPALWHGRRKLVARRISISDTMGYSGIWIYIYIHCIYIYYIYIQYIYIYKYIMWRFNGICPGYGLYFLEGIIILPMNRVWYWPITFGERNPQGFYWGLSPLLYPRWWTF